MHRSLTGAGARDGSVHGIRRTARQCVLARQQSAQSARLPTHGFPCRPYYHHQCARQFYRLPDTRTHAGTAAIAKTLACAHWETAQDGGAARVPSGSRPRPAGAAEENKKKMTKGKGKGKMAGRGRRGKRIQFFVGSLELLLAVGGAEAATATVCVVDAVGRRRRR
ncbi:hypothetical protein EDB83DRAFT_439816 [Lactarius deliciosus]|nr:hypothetical protein EDB83DRAFT_439816 [Lactarius deliciosus]